MDIKDNTGKKKNTHKKVLKHHKDPGIKIGDLFVNIDTIRAENGLVTVYMKNGEIRRKLPSKAASEAYILNQKLKQARVYQPHLVKHHEQFLEKITEVIRQAKYQQETNNPGYAAVRNFVEGKTVDGVPIEEASSEDDNIEHLMHKYPTVKDVEVAAAIRQAPSFKQGEALIKKLHTQRTNEAMKKID